MANEKELKRLDRVSKNPEKMSNADALLMLAECVRMGVMSSEQAERLKKNLMEGDSDG